MPDKISDSCTLRAIAVYTRFGVVSSIAKCCECGGPAVLQESCSNRTKSYAYACKTMNHHHMKEAVNTSGFLTQVPINSWMPFLHMTNMLRLGYAYDDLVKELEAGYGSMSHHTLVRWRRLYQESLREGLVKLDAFMVGGKTYTAVCDETVVGVHADDGWNFEAKGINKRGGTQKRKRPWATTKKLLKKGVLKRLPARTYYKTQKVMKYKLATPKKKVKKTINKKRGQKVVKRPAANLKNNGKWLWLCVEVGKGKQVLTHGDRNKRVTYRLLPRSAEAEEYKPRGFVELRSTLQGCVRKRTFLVFDGWHATNQAVQDLGYDCADPVVHEDGWRDTKTGFHTNDVESENQRVKGWSRKRYGRLNINSHEMDEYIFYTNVGTDMVAVMKGLAYANGGVACNRLL